MLDMLPKSERTSPAFKAGLSLAAAAVIFGLLMGPSWGIGLAVVAGLCATAAVIAILKLRRTDRVLGPTLLGLFCGFWFLVSYTLYALFIRPLPSHLLTMPLIGEKFSSPRPLFSIKGPIGWNYEWTGDGENGALIIRPESLNQYMGISEIQVRAKKIDPPPASADAFVKNFVANAGKPSKSVGHDLQFKTETASLLDGSQGVWTTLDARRLWLPVRQTTLYALKDGGYLCSVSATGLKPHSTLYKVMCLGLMRTLDMNTRN